MIGIGRKRDCPLQKPETLEKPFFSGTRCQFSTVSLLGSDTEAGGGVAREHLADADVAGEHLGRLVAGLAHDVALADSVHRGLGDASGAEAMSAQRLRLQAGAAGGPLHDPSHAILVESAARDLAMAVDPAEDGSGRDAGVGEPSAQRADRAGFLLLSKGNANLASGCLLVGLRPAQVDDEAVLGEGEVGAFDRGELRAAKGDGEAHQNERPVAEAQKRLRARGDDPADVAGQKRSLAFLGGADRAADPLEGLAHDKMVARRGRLFKSCRLVSLGDRGQPAGDGSRAKRSRTVSDVEGDGCGSRRQVGQVVFLAEPDKVLEVRPVGAQGGGRFGGLNVGSCLFNEVLDADILTGKAKRLRFCRGFPFNRVWGSRFRGQNGVG